MLCLVRNGIEEILSFCRLIRGEMPVSLMTRPLYHLSEQIFPLAVLGKNLLLSILLHAFAACQFLSWLGLWSFGISCEVGRASWEGWCTSRQEGVIWSGKEAGACDLSKPFTDLLSILGQWFLNTGHRESCWNLMKTMDPNLSNFLGSTP